MSVLIKGMEMPKSCNECRFSVDGWCYVCKPQSEEERKRITTNYCPLVEIPPHGRLIDADTLIVRHGWLDNFDNTHTHIQFVYANEINYTPTIIGSEEKDD